MKKIVLISSGQPSTNPRLVKEANALADAGYSVFVIYSYWTNWAWNADKLLFEGIRWIPILVGGSPNENKWTFNFTRIRLKIVSYLAKKVTFRFCIAEYSKNRAYAEVLRKAYSIKADLYIAHNLGALPIAVKAAKKNNAKCGFDAEDFHRKEISDDTSAFEYLSSKYIEDKFLPQIDYLTVASPLIGVEYKNLYPHLDPNTINNVFDIKLGNSKANQENLSKLRLFWFSQTVGKNRGIEDVIEALNILQNKEIELHLLGEVNVETREYLLQMSNGREDVLKFHDPIPSQNIIEFASQFDVGLALERKSPYNRDICLTNKIFTYLLSSLAIIASDTKAQKEFLDSNDGIGYIYEANDAHYLSTIIDSFFINRELLNQYKKNAFSLAKEKYNWERESKKLIELINQLELK